LRLLRRNTIIIKDISFNHDLSAKIDLNASVRDVLTSMNLSNKGVGFVVSDDGKLIGIITDGDVRRSINKWKSIGEINLTEIMTRDPISVTLETSLVDAQKLLTKHQITSLPIVDQKGIYLGFIDTHVINKVLSPERIYPVPDAKDPDDNTERHIARYKFAARFIQPEDVVLDCACGAGYGSAILAENAGSVLGVDISEDTIKFAHETYLRGNTNFQCSDLSDLTFAKNRFNLVISMETLEHVDAATCSDFLVKIKSWVKPGGMLIASSPMLRYENNKPYITNPYHINEMPKAEMIDLYNDIFASFAIQFFHQKQTFFLPLTSEHTGFCIIVARKPEQ
jgi:2-polyprenyl-3-methyl-5-hydroxy-6-metoxy-1,4-benzoquinol methylase